MLISYNSYQLSEFQNQLCLASPNQKNLICDNSDPSTKPSNTPFATWPLIRPQNSFIILWHVLIMLCTLWYVFEIGLLLAFRDAFWATYIKNTLWFHITFSVALGVDIWLNFVKCYYFQGCLIHNRARIYQRYVRYYIWVDLVSIVVILICAYFSFYQINILKLLLTPKIISMWSLNKQVEVCIRLNPVPYTIYVFARLILLLFICSHFIGIGFYILDLEIYKQNIYGPPTPDICWIYTVDAFYQLELLLDWSQKWAYIIYFTMGMITTIAYGDITPRNTPQCIYIIFSLILSTFLIGYTVAQIMRILIDIFYVNFIHQKLIESLKKLVKLPFASAKLQKKVNNHIDDIMKTQKLRNRSIQSNALKRLPSRSQAWLTLALNKQIFSILNLNIKVDSLFLAKIGPYIFEKWCITDQYLYNQGHIHEEDHQFYYSLMTSHIALGIGNHKIISNALSAGQRTLLRGGKNEHWAKCEKNTLTLVLKREHFLTAKQHMTLTEIQSLMKSKMNFQCILCHQSHFEHRCPSMRPKIWHKSIIKLLRNQPAKSALKFYKNVQQQNNLALNPEFNSISLDQITHWKEYQTNWNYEKIIIRFNRKQQMIDV